MISSIESRGGVKTVQHICSSQAARVCGNLPGTCIRKWGFNPSVVAIVRPSSNARVHLVAEYQESEELRFGFCVVQVLGTLQELFRETIADRPHSGIVLRHFIAAGAADSNSQFR